MDDRTTTRHGADTPRWADLAIAIITLAAFALRLARLADLGDLEFDEIVSLRYALLPPADLLPRLAGALFEHPPGYYLALGAWLALAEPGTRGDTDGIVVRALSILPGTLMVPATYGIARHAYGHRVAIWSALAIAVAPLPIFYSREARMYAATATLALVATWILLRAADGGWTRRRLVAYAGATVAGATFHYTAPLVLAAHALGSIIAVRMRPGLWRGVGLAIAVAAVAAAPWVYVATGARATIGLGSSDPATAATAPLAFAAWPGAILTALGDMTGGPDTPAWRGWPAAIAVIVLAGAGLPRDPARRVLWIVTAAGTFAVLVVALALAKPVQGRYLSALAPFAIIGTVAGLGRLAGGARWSRIVAATCAGAIAIAVVPFWPTYYGDYARADYRTLARRISALERPGDAVLLTGPWQAWYYDYYYDGGLWHTVLPATVPPPVDPAMIGPRLSQLRDENRRLWFVQAGLAQADPSHLVEAWLDANAFPVLREAYPNAVLTLYEMHPPAVMSSVSPATWVNDAGPALALSGGWVDDGQVHGGSGARLSLTFTSLAPLGGNYSASIRLVGPEGNRIGIDVPIRTATPAGPGPDTAAWAPGTSATVTRAIWLPPGTPVGRYEVRVVTYDPATLVPLRVGSGPAFTGANPGEEAVVGRVLVTLALAPYPARAVLPPRQPLVTFWTPLDPAILGAVEDPRPMIALAMPPPTIDGTTAALELAWHAPISQVGPQPGNPDPAWAYPVRPPDGSRVHLAIRDATDAPVIALDEPVAGNRFDLSELRPGEWQFDRHAIEVGALPAGTYRVTVEVIDGLGRPLRMGTDRAPGTATEVVIGRFDLPVTIPLGTRLDRWRQRAIARAVAIAPWVATLAGIRP